MAQLNANLNDYDSQEGFDPLAPGWYQARVANSEIKNGPKGDYINWEFDIIGHPNKVWDVMSLGNEVSMRRLKTLATCSGHRNPNYIGDTEELHGLECLVNLKVETDPTGQYEPKNKIKGFKPVGKPKVVPGGKATAEPQAKSQEPAAQTAPPAETAPAETTKMPWQK